MSGPADPTGNVRAARVLLSQMAKTAPLKTAAGAALMLVLTFTEGASLLLLAPLLELVGVMEENPMPSAAGWLATGFAALGLEATLGSVLVLFVGLAGARSLVRRWEARLIATVREDLVREYRLRLYRAIAAAEWRFLVTRTPSEFAVTLTSEIGRVGMAVTQMTDLAVLCLASLVYLGLALRLSPAMAALVLGSAAVLAWSVHGTLDRARTLGTRGSETRTRMHSAIAEHVASLKTARSYGALERHAAEFDDLSRASREVGLEVAASETGLQQHLELGSTFLLALIVFVSSELLHVSPPLLLVLLFVFARLMPRLVNIYRLVQALTMALPVVDAVNRLERECTAAAEPEAAEQRELVLAESLRLHGVSFGYLGRGGANAVTGLNLQIAAGATTAIVGVSGSGKTTAADLLMGLLTPTSGRILVDGEPLTSATLSSWRRQVSYVPQDAFLFHDTVRANLVWARPGATDPEVWEALRLAAADGFVDDLPRGLDTIIGERGVLLSGGERQRLSIARALLRRPRVLLLDEATSSLDAENELRIQHAIDALQHRMTIVIITHRLSTIRRADLIHVMEAGRLIQSGSWDDLSADRHGRFSELARTFAGDTVRELA